MPAAASKGAAAAPTTQKTLAFSRVSGAKPKPAAASSAAAASSSKPAASSSKPPPSAAAASAAATSTCASAPVPDPLVLCEDCQLHLDRVLVSRVATFAAAEEQMAALAQQCHACHCGGGAGNREILCVNEDCKIYWSRRKTWRSVEEAHNFLLQLDW
jgi:hypothetical protein